MKPRQLRLRLQPISVIDTGESVQSVRLPAEGQFIVGRSSDADWPIPDPSISRRHASIIHKGDAWLLTDLTSRHGTSVNDQRIEPGSPILIEDGDVLTFGSWRCRCATGTNRSGLTTPFTPLLAEATNVSAIPAQQLGGVAQRGLDVLMELTAKLDVLDTRNEVAQVAAEAIREATGCRRVVVVEIESEDSLVVLASTSEKSPRVSRSLIDQAAQQGLVQLMINTEQVNQAQSIMDLGIRSAICAPVLVDMVPSAFVTIDTRDAEGVVPPDAASFSQSVARLVGLAFQRINALVMAERHRQLKDDLNAARRAQELLSPPKQGTHGAVSYSFESVPGRIVAGDLFDIFSLDEDRTAFFLGDVSGKGVGAAMLMAACQSQLRSQLLSQVSLAVAMASVNSDLHRRTESSKFITLIAGIVNSKLRTVELADAGHGLCVYAPSEHQPYRLETTPGFPLGVVDITEYEIRNLNLDPGSSLVFFSDGAVEQTNSLGSQFGLEGVLASLTASPNKDQLVECLLNGVREHAEGPLADDLTVAALRVD
jgi:phosphoserine phosphatase RsbU/P